MSTDELASSRVCFVGRPSSSHISLRLLPKFHVHRTQQLSPPFLSAEPRAVAAARAARMPSCYFARDVPGYPKAVPADAVARNMNDVRTAVEDFCGVTFRDATTHISTRYGI